MPIVPHRAQTSLEMNIFRATAVRSVEEATRAIPVIDFGPAFRGDPGGLDAAAAKVRRACEQAGFFYSPNVASASEC